MTDRKEEPPQVARGVLLATIEYIEYYSACPFCEAGECDDDGGDKNHTTECPLFGYDMTNDIERLREWAKGTT